MLIAGVTDWEIFYADEDYVYIITRSSIEYSNLPDNTYFSIGAKKGYNFKNIPTTTLQGLKGNSNNIVLNRYYTDIRKNMNGNASRCAAYLLDSINWNAYVNEQFAQAACGTPTMEL